MESNGMRCHGQTPYAAVAGAPGQAGRCEQGVVLADGLGDGGKALYRLTTSTAKRFSPRRASGAS